VVEAAGEISIAVRVRFADDLDGSYLLRADGHVDVMHEEVPTGEHFVDIGADDRSAAR
jgi:hypothetical protein